MAANGYKTCLRREIPKNLLVAPESDVLSWRLIYSNKLPLLRHKNVGVRTWENLRRCCRIPSAVRLLFVRYRISVNPIKGSSLSRKTVTSYNTTEARSVRGSSIVCFLIVLSDRSRGKSDKAASLYSIRVECLTLVGSHSWRIFSSRALLLHFRCFRSLVRALNWIPCISIRSKQPVVASCVFLWYSLSPSLAPAPFHVFPIFHPTKVQYG